MGSSYNNFLANIEVDEKQIKRDMAKREIAKKKHQQQSQDNNKVRSKANPKTQVSGNNTQRTRQNPEQHTVSLKQGKDKAKQVSRVFENELSQKQNKKTKRSVTRREQSNIRENQSTPLRISQKGQTPLRIEDKALRNSSDLKSNIKSDVNRNVNKTANRAVNPGKNNTLTREKLKNEHIHLRQKKIHNAKDIANLKDNEKVHLTMSKTEYNQKVLGTIRENSTKFILFRDSTRLARVPKSVAFLGFYTFVLSAVMLYFFSQVAVAKMELSKVNGEYNKLNEVNAQLNIKLATAYNIDNIRQRAENELYMNKPESHQIIYISVVPENFVEYEMDTEESKKNE